MAAPQRKAISLEELEIEYSRAAIPRKQQVGFDCVFVELPQEKFQVDCPICLFTLREPHQVTCCGKSFCQTCIEPVQALRNSCPTCKLHNFSVYPNKGLKYSLYAFRVKCSHEKEGCQWTGELGELDKHLNEKPVPGQKFVGCEFAEVKCSDCGKLLPRQHFKRHCIEKHPFSCKYCHKYESYYDDVTLNHWPVCGLRPVPCRNECGMYPERQNLEHHVNSDCPLTVVNCDFHYAGCEVQLPRKDTPAHLAENLVIHMSLLATQSQNENVKRKEESVDFHRNLEVQHEEMDQQSQKISRKNVKLKEEFRQKLEAQRKEMERQSQKISKENVKLKEELADLCQKLEVQRKGMDQHRQQGRKDLGVVVGLIGVGVLVLAIILSQIWKQATDTKCLVQDMTDMREKQEQDRTELERQATALQHVYAHIRLPVVPFQITMPDFETHKAANDVWYSDPFYTHPLGYKMCLKVYANGYGWAKQTHISVFVYLMRGMFDEHLKWPLMCNITIELFDQKENKGHRRAVISFGYSKSDSCFRVTEGERAVSGWGKHDSFSHAELDKHRDNFINNGSIRFQITEIELKK